MRNINLLFHLFVRSLVVSCTCPEWELNRNLGVSGRCSNQLSYPARAVLIFLRNCHTVLHSSSPILYTVCKGSSSPALVILCLFGSSYLSGYAVVFPCEFGLYFPNVD